MQTSYISAFHSLERTCETLQVRCPLLPLRLALPVRHSKSKSLLPRQTTHDQPPLPFSFNPPDTWQQYSRLKITRRNYRTQSAIYRPSTRSTAFSGEDEWVQTVVERGENERRLVLLMGPYLLLALGRSLLGA
jgi:hypothetical protein